MKHRSVVVDVRDLDVDGGEGGERGRASVAGFDDDADRGTLGVELRSVTDEECSWMPEECQQVRRCQEKSDFRT